MTTNAERQLARQIARLSRETRTIARAAQGPWRSVDVGAGGTAYYAEDGTPLLQIGVGEDGAFGFIPVDPGPPPIPNEPDLVPTIGGIVIIWDGTFIDANWPTNLLHVEIHVSGIGGFEATDMTQVGVFTSTSGGEFTFATPNDTSPRWVALVAVTTSAVESPKSPEVSAAGLAALTGEVMDQIEDITAQVNNNTAEIANNAAAIENNTEIAYSALDTAATADGRISISDYIPGPEDIAGRNNGSMWFTRTRARTNYCTNPSFEVDVNDWTAANATITREAASPVISGGFAARIVNNGATAEHVVQWAPAGVKMPVEPGQSVAWSGFAELLTGSGVGYLARIVFYDALDVPVGLVDGTPVDLLFSDWVRPWVIGVAPDLAVKVGAFVLAPSTPEVASDNWYIDGGQFEQAEDIGRYFDGRSYDGAWNGTADASTSSLGGGKITAVYELADNSWLRKWFTAETLTDLNASTITMGYMDGERIQDNSIPIDKITGVPAQTLEALSAGDFVNIVSIGGMFECQKACAADGRECHGYVLTDVAAGEIAVVYNMGYNPFVANLIPGNQFLSTTPGEIQPNPPTDVGNFVQGLGAALGPTIMYFTSRMPIYLI